MFGRNGRGSQERGVDVVMGAWEIFEVSLAFPS